MSAGDKYAQIMFDNMSKFTLHLATSDRASYPINGFGIGLPPDYESDPSLSEAELQKSAESECKFIIFSEEHLTDEQKQELLRQINEKFFHFLCVGPIVAS